MISPLKCLKNRLPVYFQVILLLIECIQWPLIGKRISCRKRPVLCLANVKASTTGLFAEMLDQQGRFQIVFVLILLGVNS
ncbi:hypothetical protein CS542_01620 [Pedobacter sp. IW39]|nr:hypothetical protein CS542_01620 [Pedobacter sp. IW39]